MDCQYSEGFTFSISKIFTFDALRQYSSLHILKHIFFESSCSPLSIPFPFDLIQAYTGHRDL